MLNPTQYSACEFVDMVLKKEISPTELLEFHLVRFRDLSSELNAIVYTQIEKATERAKKLEGLLMRGEAVGALYGLPMTIKESYDRIEPVSYCHLVVLLELRAKVILG